MMQQFAIAWRFFQDNNWRTILRRMNARDTHPMIQFIKYGICGVAATLTHNVLLYVVTALWLPAGRGMIVDGVALEEATRVYNLKLANARVFPVGVIVAYVTNVLWVFTTGRHSRVKEFALFAITSALGFFPALFALDALAGWLGLTSTVAQLGFILTSVAVNFACRKFIIFKS